MALPLLFGLETAKFQNENSNNEKRSRYGVGYSCLFSWVLSGTSTQIRCGTTLLFKHNYFYKPIMKNFLLTLICLIALNKSFCQSFTYDAFLMGEQNSHLTSYPVPITIKSFTDGMYIIEANGFNGQIKINDTIKFDQFNQWEELYRYKGISRTVFDGNGGRIELTTYKKFTTKHKMSDFANGLNINSNTISDDFEINIENKTVHTLSAIPSYRDEKYSYITIVPYMNGNLEQEGQGGKPQKNETKDETNKAYNLSGRIVVSLPKPGYPVNDEGNVVVKINVDKNGKVVNAEPGVEGTTTSNTILWSESKKAALKAIFNIDENASDLQQGTITYRFILE